MSVLLSDVHARLHREQLLAEAEHGRRLARAARLPTVPLRLRAIRWRRRFGFRLVEVGLRLAVAPPPD